MGKAEEEMENKHSGLSWINRKPPRVQQLLGALRRLGDEEIYSLPNSNKVMPQSGMSIGVMPHFIRKKSLTYIEQTQRDRQPGSKRNESDSLPVLKQGKSGRFDLPLSD